MSKTFSREEVSKHNKNGDLVGRLQWIIIDSTVYDVSKFASLHPGGLAALSNEEVAGQDATDSFFELHRFEVLQRPQYSRLKIGHIHGEEPQITSRPPGSPSEVPFAEPTWLSKGYYSPYYNESHRRLQQAIRKFNQEVVFPDAQAREEDGKRASKHIFEARARLNLPAMGLGPGPHLQGLTLMDGAVKPEEFDCFHELVMIQEGSRLHARGYTDGLAGGTYIALPPIMRYARPEIRDRIVKEVFAGEKFLSLAVTEAYAGSDVAGIRTRANKTQGGWIVNGRWVVLCENSLMFSTPIVYTYRQYPGQQGNSEFPLYAKPKTGLKSIQKWITNGTFADYFVTACKNETEGGIVVLLIERGEGIETRLIHTSYSTAAGTAFITFDDVFVPDAHVLGPSTDGLRIILSNFNHERWAMACGSIGTQRAIAEECFKWAVQRKVFGKPLISQAVIRSKLAGMISRVESGQNWLENVTYQMTRMNSAQQAALLAG
ncbi:hypothetical protein V5O48_014597 [Marasmius crinis-equi]|uniref:Cytochrome b5 heme-binding domain-containing protein n=1 Tax=Marasmius crinis-equi TaxID=585013 RepID=A0ABR3EWW0_9AGAR